MYESLDSDPGILFGYEFFTLSPKFLILIGIRGLLAIIFKIYRPERELTRFFPIYNSEILFLIIEALEL